MSNQCLRSDQVIKCRNLAYMLLKLIAAHPDTFVAKIKNVPAGWGWMARDSSPSW